MFLLFIIVPLPTCFFATAVWAVRLHSCLQNGDKTAFFQKKKKKGERIIHFHTLTIRKIKARKSEKNKPNWAFSLKNSNFFFRVWLFSRPSLWTSSLFMEVYQNELATPENTITYHNAFGLSSQNILHKHCLQFLLGVKMAPRETENNAYAKFWGDKQRTLYT